MERAPVTGNGLLERPASFIAPGSLRQVAESFGSQDAARRLSKLADRVEAECFRPFAKQPPTNFFQAVQVALESFRELRNEVLTELAPLLSEPADQPISAVDGLKFLFKTIEESRRLPYFARALLYHVVREAWDIQPRFWEVGVVLEVLEHSVESINGLMEPVLEPALRVDFYSTLLISHLLGEVELFKATQAQLLLGLRFHFERYREQVSKLELIALADLEKEVSTDSVDDDYLDASEARLICIGENAPGLLKRLSETSEDSETRGYSRTLLKACSAPLPDGVTDRKDVFTTLMIEANPKLFEYLKTPVDPSTLVEVPGW
jgi:hypothetical protein